MYLQMNCLQEGKDKLVELILYLEQQHAAKSLQAERYQKESFQQFQEYDLWKFTVKMLVEDAKRDLFLKKFCFLKFQAIFDKHTENQLFGHLVHSDCILQMEKHLDTPFYTSFCKFAVSVWQV
ncbi:unnamed protein product [Sphagnum jensenii]|uniref:Uncharacterized protein n=1 Tax=Sphagnum jensenii TaxID=128206 RepID=A0ABP1AR75_9BRYO